MRCSTAACAATLFCCVTLSGASLIESAKAVDVATLDPSLPHARLDDWLTNQAHARNVRWQRVDCERKESRRCVRFAFGDPDQDGMGIVRMADKPTLEDLLVPPYGWPAKLSELPTLISKQRTVVDYAKKLNVADLDPTLDRADLESWLRTGPAHLQTIRWGASDCDLKDPPDHPLCVEFGFARDDIGGWGMITVGTIEQGIDGPPYLEYVVVMYTAGAPKIFRVASKLSELPCTIDDVVAAKIAP